ncbi:MAG: Phosphoenolpyruvate carboxylase [Cytophagales bacterium]|nr:phosphoenolpyruvate carboxylase [Bacteroidota bacterium]MBS1980182.1 phosphoenolpyruvate carboxylase [Bacteroidota bacterium]WHZ08697.1 MAG: Phosphoenolpyruvate carboxylase [Cytophagales bacterium]
MLSRYDEWVGSRFHIYNSLFLNLPFHNILRTGTLLPLLQQECAAEFEKGTSANDIIEHFFRDYAPSLNPQDRFDILFNFIQYVERQVALFDSVEDAAFEEVNNIAGNGTVPALLLQAKYEDKIEELKSRMDEFSLRLVLTAHPTQFYPGHVLGILTDLEGAIRSNNLRNINLLLSQMGKTAFINQEKPTPYDEAVSLCWYLENVFYNSIPQVIQSLAEGVQLNLSEWSNNRLVVIGFWPGGDRDGNPFVTSEITLRVAARLRESVFKCYYNDIRLLRRRLTFRGVNKIIIEIERKIFGMVFSNEKNYHTPDEILRDLKKARTLLVSEHNGLFLDLLDAFILKLNLFGFHFASLDVRQDSRKHDAVWTEIITSLHATGESLSYKEFEKRKQHEQIEYLLSLNTDIENRKWEDTLTYETIHSLLAIKKIQQENGKQACHRYVISNCQSALHIIEVFVLAKLLMGNADGLELDIIPLFETIDDLAHAPRIMDEIYSIPAYRDHLLKRKSHQTIMLGFSDGTKDGGYLRANWSIFRAKENLTAVSRKHAMKALFFDGRGGPPARGGGNTHDFYSSLGNTIEHQEVQITIQGQTISSNFGKPTSSKYNLEQLLSSGLEGKVFDRKEGQLSEENKQLLDDLAEEAYRCYLDLKNDSKFVPYLEKVTPLSFFGDTNISSRPVKRNTEEKLKFSELRAIPFVGTWAIMKQTIPGFYGVGTALHKLSRQGRESDLKKLYVHSLFFRTLLDNSMMSLTKSNYSATAYLADDPEFGDFWKKMHNEFILSKEMLLKISGMSELMENNPMIKESVRLRERIVLPLIAIQQYALMNLRNMSKKNKSFEQKFKKLVIRCMFGIINAARNSA